MKTLIGASVAAVAFTIGGLGVGAAVGAPSAPQDITYEPAAHTIVAVAGDKRDGWTVRHYDGTVDHLPADAETRAACRELDTEVERVRCRVELRVWYHDLGDLKEALNYAYSDR